MDLDNKMADMTVRIAVNQQDLMNEIGKTNQSILRLRDSFADQSKHMETLETLQEFNSKKVLESQEQMTKLDGRFSKEIGDAQAGLIDLRSKFEEQITKLTQSNESMQT